MTWTENRARIFSAEAQNCLVLLSCTWIGFCSTRRLRKSEENRPPAKTKAASCSPSKTRTRYVPRHSLKRPSTPTMVRHPAGPTHPAHAYAPCQANRSPPRSSQSPKSKPHVQEPGRQRRKKKAADCHVNATYART